MAVNTLHHGADDVQGHILTFIVGGLLVLVTGCPQPSPTSPGSPTFGSPGIKQGSGGANCQTAPNNPWLQ